MRPMESDTMEPLKRILNSPYVFWALLALPSLGIIQSALDGAELKRLLHPTGEFAARFTIVALMLTPLRMLFPKSQALAWLMRRRRYLGVAAFGYAALHLTFYVIDQASLGAVLADATKARIWTGWIAFLIFVPLALTSNEASIRLLGRRWKNMQRAVYAAAVAILAHWMLAKHGLVPAIIHFLPLAGLETYRIMRVNGICGTGTHSPSVS
jgi:sulfoxide reductase heme-binding subunit YedZ